MDHLPIPDHCKKYKLEVPHRNLVSYDRQGFSGFPERLGHTPADVVTMFEVKDKIPMAESILQEWFYFGTLHFLSEVSQVPIDLDHFIKIDENGKRTVVSHHWPEYYAAISAKETPFTQEQHEELEKKLNYIADGLGAVVQRFNRWYNHLTPSILFAIFILVETVYDTLRLLSKRETHIKTRFLSPSPGRYFEKRMQENGWCLASIQGVLHGNTSVAYFASLLPAYDDKQHLDCTSDKCFKVHKEVAEVTCQHAELACAAGNECEEVLVDQSELTVILDQGSFPAVTLRHVDGKIQVNVVDAQNHYYVAISHVWAHGLGNPHANSMPCCQIRRIAGLIDQVSQGQDPALWIDTLCVPVHSKRHRKLSISRLRTTYKQAAKVLILDRQLLQVQSTNVCEAVCQALCSDWMSRLWTLQEGLLPDFDSLYIQYQDRPVLVKSLCGDGSPMPMPYIVENRLRDLLSSMFLDRGEFRNLKDQENLRGQQDSMMLTLMRNLQRRRTTKAEDEPICIATLMDIDLGKFERMPSMEDIYRYLFRLPRNLIFAGSPRLKTPGFRWAPSTFLEQPITGFKVPGGTLSTLGLATGNDFDFMALSVSLSNPITIQRGHTAYIIEFPGGQKEVFFLPDFQPVPDLQEVSVQKPAIVMGDQAGFSQDAVLVEVTDDSRYGRSMHGSYRLAGYIVQMDRSSPSHFPGTHFETVKGEHPLNMNWYVD